MFKPAISIAFIIAMAIAVNAQSYAFTYQGRLTDNNFAANGNYDLTFRIFDASSGGAQHGSVVYLPNVPVTNGIFTVRLDFGDNFPGTPRYLEVGVRVGGSGLNFTDLAPRQELTSAPYAVKSLNADAADFANSATNATQLGGLPASDYVQVTDTRLTDARQPLPGSTNYIQNSLGLQSGASFNISGNGTASGTLSGGAVNAATQYNIAGQRIMSNGGSNNMFTGSSTGAGITTGANNAFFGASAGDSTTAGSLNSFFGSSAGQANVSGGNNSFFGYHSGFNSTGNNNSFFGSNAGVNNSSGFNNSIFGKDAGFNVGSSNSNAFFGYVSGFNNNTGNLNSFFGAGSGQTNTSGGNNSFFGYNAGRDNNAGDQDTFVGATAGLNNENGSGNAFVGYGAGGGNTTGSNNVFMGLNAGDTNDTGGKNTVIGGGADLFGSNLNNATAIGANATVGQSNALILGSINGVNNATADTKVGIGTIYPSERLTIETPSNSYGWVHTQGTITVGSYVGGTGAQPYGGWIGTKSNHPLSFFVNGGGAAMTLETSGFLRLNNVDIGGSGPSLCLNASNHISFCSSSLRYKTNIAAFTPGLKMLKQLMPITFDWKDGGGHDVGFGAEEVAKVSDLLVIHNKQGQVEGVKYDRITTVLVNAVKEQQAQIEAQSIQLQEQKTMINTLRQLVCSTNKEAPVCR